jgi:hypothetical protein
MLQRIAVCPRRAGDSTDGSLLGSAVYQHTQRAYRGQWKLAQHCSAVHESVCSTSDVPMDFTVDGEKCWPVTVAYGWGTFPSCSRDEAAILGE